MSLVKALLRLVLQLLKLALWPAWWIVRAATRPRGAWVHLKLRSRIEELPDPRRSWLARWVPPLAHQAPTSLATLHELEAKLVDDPRITGVLVEVPPLHAGWAKIHSLRRWILRLRAAGKTVAVYLPQGGSHRELFLATAADRVVLAPVATLTLLGLSATTHYFKGALTQAGIRFERFAHGDYKTAYENLSEDAMSATQRTQLTELLAAWHGALTHALATDRKLDPSQIATLFEVGFFQNEEAIQAGLVDAIAFEDEIPTVLGLGSSRPIPAGRFLAWAQHRWWSPLRKPPYLAVVAIGGLIAEHNTHGGRAHAVADLRTAGADRRARGVIVLIDSPGGSPLVSDLLHREILRLRESKPVIALMSDVAASGGYYIAAAGDVIVADPLSITGSIGVVGGLPKVDALLERLGVRTEVVRTAPHADLHKMGTAMTPADRSLIERELDALYRRFVDVVAQGRHKTWDEIDRLARGRVWSGSAAREHGLVDELGGLRTAVELLRKRIAAPPSLLRRLEPRRVHARHHDLPPPAPRPLPAALAGWLEATVGPSDLVEALAYGAGPLYDGAGLYYAADLPTIR